MHKKRSHHEIILDSVADGVFTVDREWTITSFNRAAEDITGVSREQAIDQKCFDVLRADVCQSACVLKRTLETGEPEIDHRVNILNCEGVRVPISISTAVLKDDAGEVVGGVETFRDLSAVEMLRKELNAQYSFEDIVSKNHRMLTLFNTLPDVAISDSSVLIEGPSGSGKNLVARAIHNLSVRKDGNYVVVNCSALPETLLESELFGYVKGAFTGARGDKPGRFALAEGGTIFLDDISDISPALQVKLLRVIQEKEFEPLGGTSTTKADVRVIAAANRSLSQLVEQGLFRADLFYRLNVVRLVLPSLAERREDIPLLVDHFVWKLNNEKGKTIEGVSEAVTDLLMRHQFPGNVRELENIIEHAFVLCRERTIQVNHLPQDFVQQLSEPPSEELFPEDAPLEHAEKSAIVRALERHHGNRQQTAESLGIDRSTLWRKMKKYRIDLSENSCSSQTGH